MDSGGYVALDGIYACICADRCCKVKGGGGCFGREKRGNVVMGPVIFTLVRILCQKSVAVRFLAETGRVG